ncbi:MAG: Si-specific NAD(P)(+) transhydrogenase [Dehalococcoidia bacterium]
MADERQYRYDLIVIGAGPAGERGATRAASLDKNVALIEKDDLGGAAVNTGTLPSKTLRETALYLSGIRQRGLYGVDYSFDREVTVDDLIHRQREVVRSHQMLAGQSIARHSVELFQGTATFQDAHTVQVSHGEGRTVTLDASFVLIATGSRPFHPPGIRFDSKFVHDSDSILRIKRIPKSMVIVGAGIIGCEYATLLSVLGISVALIDNDDKFLPMLDEEIAGLLMERMRALGISLVFQRRVESVQRVGEGIAVSFKEGDELTADVALFCVGRSSNVEAIALDHAGILLGERGCIVVNEDYQTTVPNIYAAGDVIGSPALASTAMEQAQGAVRHMFGAEIQHEASEAIPTGLYTIPEVAMVGATEQTLQEKGQRYAVGRALYRHNPRGQIVGDMGGLLKLVFEPESRLLLGVHIIGEQAAELIHIGQACMHFRGTIDVFTQSVFNFPTLSDLYKYAAYDGLERLR